METTRQRNVKNLNPTTKGGKYKTPKKTKQNLP